MYRYSNKQVLMPLEFFLPFGGKLNPENRWCKYAMIVPWKEVEEKYAKNFNSGNAGKVALSVRMALGSLLIQNYKALSDRETVEEITENPYLQFFIGLPGFVDKAPFNPSLLVRFRKRLSKDIVNQINEMLVKSAKKSKVNDINSGIPK
jgi:transposase, IS5 family